MSEVNQPVRGIVFPAGHRCPFDQPCPAPEPDAGEVDRNTRRLAWFSDDELRAELDRRAAIGEMRRPR